MQDFIILECSKHNIKLPNNIEFIEYSKLNIYLKTELTEMRKIAKSRKAESWCPYCAGTAKKTIKEMNKIAEKKSGKCLSEEYENVFSKLKWLCKEGHTWKATPDRIIHGSWCPYCSGNIKATIKEMQELAQRRGGICLSKEYVNDSTKLEWQCKENHIWKTAPSNIKQNHWCPYCAGVVKLTIQEMEEIAESRGGKCLSSNYINYSTNLTWQCDKEHEWDATPKKKKKGTWCPICARIKRKK